MKRAFTLVELLVGISVIGILLAILLPALNAAHKAGKKTKCISQMRQLAIATVAYEAFQGDYPHAPTYPSWDQYGTGTFILRDLLDNYIDMPEPSREEKTNWVCPLDRDDMPNYELAQYRYYGTSYSYHPGTIYLIYQYYGVMRPTGLRRYSVRAIYLSNTLPLFMEERSFHHQNAFSYLASYADGHVKSLNSGWPNNLP